MLKVRFPPDRPVYKGSDALPPRVLASDGGCHKGRIGVHVEHRQ